METVLADAGPGTGDWDLAGPTPQKNSKQITTRTQKNGCGLPQIFTKVYLLCGTKQIIAYLCLFLSQHPIQDLINPIVGI